MPPMNKKSSPYPYLSNRVPDRYQVPVLKMSSIKLHRPTLEINLLWDK
jgi:hypothetical protein